MTIQLTLSDFPMLSYETFKSEMANHNLDVKLQVGGEDTVFAMLTTDDVVKAEVFIALCDKYQFAKGGDVVEEGLPQTVSTG